MRRRARRRYQAHDIMSMRDQIQRPERGVELLVEHLLALDPQPPNYRRRPALERLSVKVGPDLAGMLVYALSGKHGMRRRDLVA